MSIDCKCDGCNLVRRLAENLEEIQEEAQGDLDRDILMTAIRDAFDCVEKLKGFVEDGITFRQESFVEH